MQSFGDLLLRIFDPAVASAPLVALIALVALLVVGMAVYAVVLALKALARRY